MFKLEIIKLYAEDHNMDFNTAKEVATPYELFDTYLRYEGFIGYTDAIITAFRECFLENLYEYRIGYIDTEEDEEFPKMQYIETIANSAQDAADKARRNRVFMKGFCIKIIWKKCGNSYIAVNAWN